MDDEKKITPENNRVDEFEDFNFTDEFPEEFSDFTAPPQKNDQSGKTEEEDDFFTSSFNQQKEENPEEDLFSHDQTFDQSFDQTFDDTFKPENPFDETLKNVDIDNIDNIPPAMATERKGNILKRHPFITLIAVVILIFGGYQLMKRATGPGGEMTPVVETAQKAVHQIAGQAPPEVRLIDERLDTLEKGMAQISEQLKTLEGAGVRLEQMEQMVTKITEQETNLQSTLTQLEALTQQVSALTQLSQRMNTLEAQVKAISGNVELYTTISEQTQRAANLSRQTLQAKSMMPVPMVVQAAIPGRAWLLSEFGELITVARGDEVPGYGKVLNIDPVAGTVTMSSETVFREE